jgi:DNA replication and repair protein RecF
MSLQFFNAINFRNLENLQLNLSSRSNLFYGQNGSGKTSILESLYYLGVGRSFRSHLFRRILKYGAESFSLFGKINHEDNQVPVGIEKSLVHGKTIRIAGENAQSNTEIVKLLPLQLLNQDSYRFFDEGPKIRRQFIDWGVFHVEQCFLNTWRKYERALEQRNAALRSNSKIDYIKLWDIELATLGNELHLYRNQYLDKLIPVIHKVLNETLPVFEFDLKYYPGWNLELGLEKVLANSLSNDMRLGYSSFGAHRADLQISVKNVPAQDVLSRGQQKLLLFGIQIAQGILLRSLSKKNCVYLVDDLTAELDSTKRVLLSNLLLSLETQIFVTGLDDKDLIGLFGQQNHSMFHVEQGVII